jgi:nitrous oxidase accessory protein NosD
MKRRALLLLGLVALVGALAAPVAGTAATLSVCPSGCPYSTIQAAVNAAAAGDRVAVGGGTYVENVVIDRPLTLQGAGEPDGDDGRPVIVPAVSSPNPCAGSSLCGGAASNIILVQADDVTIRGLVLDGDNPSLTSGITRDGADLDARNGIITNHALGTFQNLTVSRVTVRNIYLRGIYASSGGTFEFRKNRVSNVQGEAGSIAIFNFGGSGVIADNRVSDASDAIASNWSGGVRFLDNEVTRSGTGVHTDNAGGSGGPATPDLIAGNTVKHCQTDGYGIFVFVPYVAPVVRNNEVRGCSVGLAAFGQGAVVTTQFVGNTVNGASASSSDPSSSLGVIVSTDILGFGSTDVSASFRRNAIQHFGTGVYVEQQCELFAAFFPTDCPAGSPTQATAVLHDNVINGNDTGASGLPGTSVDAEDNWWGCRKGPNQPGCDTATGTVDFTPWLTKPPKTKD